MIELAKSTRLLTPSAMQKSLNVPNKEEYISFALGLPANEALPLALLQKSVARYNNNSVMQYSPSISKLKSQIKNLVKERGINCDEEEIFISAGAQQGINLLTRLLTDKGSSVITEELVYPGFLQVTQSIGVKIIAIPSNYKTGINLDILEKTLKRSKIKPSLIYIVADGNNPLGLNLNLENRKRLVLIAKEYKIPILEDDPYGFLYYEQQQYPALKALERDYVCYIGSFSKIIAPALRVGWVIVPKHLICKLSILKESSDIDTATFSQRIVSTFIEDNYLTSHLTKIQKLYKEKRDVMNNCIKKYLPDHTKFMVPENGIYFWLKFDKIINTEILFQRALEKKVIIIPGNSFSALGNKIASNCIRLSFSFSSNGLNPIKVRIYQ